MKKFIPYAKLSKKEKRRLDNEKRGTIIGQLLSGYIIITLKYNNKKLIDRKITTNHVKP